MSAYVYEFAKSTISRALGSNLPNVSFTVGEQQPLSAQYSSYWAIHKGSKKDDNSPVTVFIFDCARHRDKITLAKNALKRSRTIRHPDVLRFVDGAETDTQILIATEAVTPLSEQLNDLDPNLVAWGLYRMATVIKFLNVDCSMIHGNLQVGSIYTTKAGEWKLGGLDLLCSLKEDSPILINNSQLVPGLTRYGPPEVRTGSWATIRSNPIHAVDSWAFGCLIHELFNGPISGSIDPLDPPGKVPQSLVSAYRRLITADPKRRVTVETLLGPGKEYFNSNFIQVCLFMEQISLKDAHEKEAFLRKVNDSLDSFPSDFTKYKLLPALINALEYGSLTSTKSALPSILRIGSAHLSSEEYEQAVIPVLVRLFASTERGVRVSLCESLDLYVEHVSPKVINEKIFPYLAMGFTDTSPVIRELTVKAILSIVTKLTDRIINNDVLRYLAKLQTDEEPGIRANTTICLGKISKYLNDSTRKKVLIPAFTRALRDPFPPSRNAALLAISATLDYYDGQDIAIRIFPNVCPMMVDPERQIRVQALKTGEVLLRRAEKYANEMPEPVKAVENGAQAPSAGASQTSPSSDWAGWAVSALGASASKLSGSLSSSLPILGSTSKPPASATSPSEQPESAGARPSTDRASQDWRSASSMSMRTAESPVVANIIAPATAKDDSGWDDFDEWKDDELAVVPTSSKPLNGVTTSSPLRTPSPATLSSRLAYATPPPAPAKPSSNGKDSGWDDWGAGWDDNSNNVPAPTKSPVSPPSGLSTAEEGDWGSSGGAGSPVFSKSTAEKELERERRKQRMAELREQRKANKLGAKRI
ncbi:armadillo-type protein [Cladochytrium replicatum]|nr:armadillo-type protein [Cladochytrium replicatum]